MERKSLLVLALFATILCGCGNNSSSSNGGQGTSSSGSNVGEVSSTSSQNGNSSNSSVSSNNPSVSVSYDPVVDNYNGTYYKNITDSMTGSTLQSELKKIITNGHNARGYDALWNAYKTTDIKPGTSNIIWDMYSNCNYVVGKDQLGSYSGEGDGYNREHSIPQSWFNKNNPMVCDVHHIYPTDGKVNGMRSNYPYGEVGSASYTSKNGSKLGSSSFPGYSGRVFEPIDEYKGDFARTYFYFATRYPGVATLGEGGKIFSNSYPYLTKYAIELFTKWSQMDPVSQKEITRNEAAYKFQGNRNPFIDHPSYIAKIFGTYGGTIPTPTPNPNPDTSSDSTSQYTIVKPVVGETYKVGMDQTNKNAIYWIIGTTKDSTPWYLSTSTAYNDGCNVIVEEVEGGYYIALKIGNDKKYLNMVLNDNHKNASIGTTPSTVYTYDETYKTFVGEVGGEKCFFGTYGDYVTLSCNSYSKISTSFPAHFYK